MEKLKSRKFQVWLSWLIISILSIFISDLPKEIIFNYLGLVSMIYIGGNVAQDFIFKKNEK